MRRRETASPGSRAKQAACFLERLADPACPALDGPILILVAHPDDEAIGCGAQLSRMRDLVIVHVTDGAPAGLEATRAAGFADRDSYAMARREEALAALAGAGAANARFISLGVIDQKAAFQIAAVADRIAGLIRDLRPEAILTHPYEGGHPDHDSTAAALQLACAMIGRGGAEPPPVLEMAFYHREGEGMATGRFLPNSVMTEAVIHLGPEQQNRKQSMLNCYRSQHAMLALFGCGEERFRIACDSDYSRPPHEPPLWYEQFDWGIDGARWRALAEAAFAELEDGRG
jgi:LmbE family N-acetylglucosaminyl deacetylase